MEEIWKKIEGYDEKYNYEVSNIGRVRKWYHHGKRLDEPRLVPQRVDNRGYVQVHLFKDGKEYTKSVHRLVAIVFIENPNNLDCVNHINEIKHDNMVENLEWCTKEYNNNYGTRNERLATSKVNGKKSKPVVGINKKTGEVVEFPSISEVQRKFNISSSHISKCCKCDYGFKSAGGYYWKYK